MEVKGKANVEVGSRFSVELTRGQRGSYGWVIKVRSDDEDDLLSKVEALDGQLKLTYGNGNDNKEGE
jgi:hypothetical protein